MISPEDRAAIEKRADGAKRNLMFGEASHSRRITNENSAADVPRLLDELARVEQALEREGLAERLYKEQRGVHDMPWGNHLVDSAKWLAKADVIRTQILGAE